MNSYQIGQRVRVRSKEWTIKNIEYDQNDALLSMESDRNEYGHFEQVQLFSSLDKIEILSREEFDFIPGNYQNIELINQAYFLDMKHGNDLIMSLARGRVAIEDYQLEPVVKSFAMKNPRMLIADDVGLGKTVEAGLILNELISRNMGERVLVVAPASLTAQWKNELKDKFDLHFDIYNYDNINEIRQNIPSGANPWSYRNKIIASIDYLKRDDIKYQLKNIHFDCVIIDECHYLSESGYFNKVSRTARSRFGQFIAERCDSLILLSATPHNGNSRAYYSLISLLNGFLAPDESMLDGQKLSKYVIRRLKRDIHDSEGNPYFKNRNIHDVNVNFNEQEKAIYQSVTNYVKKRYEKAQKALDGSGRQQLNAIAFAMLSLRKRLISSSYALKCSLENRLNALDYGSTVEIDNAILNETQTFTENEIEEIESQVLSQVYYDDAKRLEAEKNALRKMIAEVSKITQQNDSKLAKLIGILREFDQNVIVFTEYRDTQTYLLEALKEQGFKTVHINGKMSQESRREQIDIFNTSKDPLILVATDAASEGLNLQDNCHTLINYELPWNPNRLEQRNGRVDRWGQLHDVHIHNFYLDDTLEADILKKLLTKIETIRRDLGSVSDLVGENNFDLTSDFIKFGGIKTGSKTQTETLDAKTRKIDKEFETNYQKIKEFKAKKLLVEESFDAEKSRQIEEIKANSTLKLPDFDEIKEYFELLLEKKVFTMGSIKEIEDGLYRVAIPYELRYDKNIEVIEKATFSRSIALKRENKEVEFLTPSHPLIKQLFIFAKSLINNDKINRVGARLFATDKEGLLLNYYLKFRDKRGRIIAEYLHPVFIDRSGIPSSEPSHDEELLFKSQKANIGQLKDQINAYTDLFERFKSIGSETLQKRIQPIEREITSRNIAQIEDELQELREWEKSVRDHYLDVYDQRQMTLDLDIEELQYRKRQFQRKMDELNIRVREKKERIEDAGFIQMDDPLLLTVSVVIPQEASHA